MQIKISLFLILKQLGQRLFFFFLGKSGSHLDCLSSKYTIYVHCHPEDVYSNLKRVNVVFMLFSFIYLYWCPTWFQCQMMFLSYYRKTRSVTSIRETSYPHPPEHLSSSLVLCRVRVVQSVVVCAVFYISQFFLLSVSIGHDIVRLLSVSFGHVIVRLLSILFGHDIVCLFRCTASAYLFDIFKPFLHSCKNCHVLVICVLKWVQMIYIFRQYMYLLLINCEGKFKFCVNLFFLLILLFLVVHNIWVDIINGRPFWWIYF